jgi:hypothetical protein
VITRMYVYSYEAASESVIFSNHTLTARGNVPIEHEIGEPITAQMVRSALEAHRLHELTPGPYRVIPNHGAWGPVVDVTVEASVVLA